MYRRLRGARAGYPIEMYFGDFEHLTANVKIPDLREMHDLGTRFLDWALKRRHARRPRAGPRRSSSPRTTRRSADSSGSCSKTTATTC